MRRHLIGIIALVLLLGAAAFWLLPPGGGYPQFEAACLRVGALLAVLWLAYPDVRRMPAWFWAALPVLVIVLAKWPRWILVAIPILIALAVLRPRPGK